MTERVRIDTGNVYGTDEPARAILFAFIVSQLVDMCEYKVQIPANPIQRGDAHTRRTAHERPHLRTGYARATALLVMVKHEPARYSRSGLLTLGASSSDVLSEAHASLDR
jgi:hypothetical protein